MYFDANSVIKKKITIGNSNDSNINQLNIAYGIDKNFFLGCAVSITSILLTNLELNFNFHIFTNSINDDFQQKLHQLTDKYKTQITIYLVEDSYFNNLPTTLNWTLATYFRFIVADYFYNKIDKILYLDADIVCKGSLIELFNLKFDNNLAYVVIEKDPIWWEKCAKRLNENKFLTGYFNAGFLLVNLKKWKENNINEKALKLLTNENLRKKFTHLDQDALNLLLLDKVKYLDRKYNQQVNLNYELKNKSNISNYSPITNETVLIHYIGPTKPWHDWTITYECSKCFLDVKAKSPWKTVPLSSATTSKQLRYCSKHKLHQNKICSGIFYFIKYSFFKIKIHKFFTFHRKIR